MTAKVGLLDRVFYSLGLLERNSRLRVHPTIFTGIVGYHLLALLACIPWLFSWPGLIAAVAGIYVFGSLGINIGFHRLLTHRGFVCPKWLERVFSILGTCCWQGTPLNWVAIHRMHHQHSDDDTDPHSPKTGGFFWSHMGWFMVYDPQIWSADTYGRYVRDLVRERFYKRIERKRTWRAIQLAQMAVFFLGGAIGGLIATETWEGALQLGLSMLVWGVFVRTVAVWHITWSVNSITHMWGYRNFKTKDDSRNNWLVGVFGGGEGWHNNHHAQPRSAAHGMRWFELDWSWATIWTLERMGLVWNVVRPRPIVANAPTEDDDVITAGPDAPAPVQQADSALPETSVPVRS